MAKTRGALPAGGAGTNWFLQLRGPPEGLHRKYVSWLGRECSWSDTAALALYAVVCLVMSLSMLRQSGEKGVPDTLWLFVGFLVREIACLSVLWLQVYRKNYYTKHRSKLLLAVQLTCHTSGLLLETPATFWIHPVDGNARHLTPIVGQIFEVLGFRVSFVAHVVRVLLDIAFSYTALVVNMHFGWAGSLLEHQFSAGSIWTVFVFEFVVCNACIMTGLMWLIEKRSVSSFLSSPEAQKVLENMPDEAQFDTAVARAHLTGSLCQWAHAHRAWVPQCSMRVISLKFHDADHQTLTPELCSGIRLAVADRLSSRFFASQLSLFHGCIRVGPRYPPLSDKVSVLIKPEALSKAYCVLLTFQMVSTNFSDFVVREPTVAAQPTPSQSCSSGSSSSPTGNDSPSSSGQEVALQDIESILTIAPANWSNGSVSGYCDSVGCFELVEDNIVVQPQQPIALPQIFAVSPVCCPWKAEAAVKLQILCSMCPGDPIICLQDGLRIPVDVLSSQQLDSVPMSDNVMTYEVTLLTYPRFAGYLELHIISKGMLIPFNSSLRTVNETKAADQAYEMLTSKLEGTCLVASDVTSQPVPVLLLDSATAAEELQVLVAPTDEAPDSARSSLDRMGDIYTSDSGDDMELESTSTTGSSKIQHVEGFCHFPLVTDQVDLSCYEERIARFQQVAPTLTLCGVVKTYFRLQKDNTGEAEDRKVQLLMSNSVQSQADWERMVESCILFFCRNGLPSATMEYLLSAQASNLCLKIRDLLHYAVASGSVGLVDVLVRKFGATLSEPSDYGTTPLHLAAAIDCPNLLHSLLQDPGNCDIAIRAKDNSGKSAAEYAFDLGLTENVMIIQQRCKQLGLGRD